MCTSNIDQYPKNSINQTTLEFLDGNFRLRTWSTSSFETCLIVVYKEKNDWTRLPSKQNSEQLLKHSMRLKIEARWR